MARRVLDSFPMKKPNTEKKLVVVTATIRELSTSDLRIVVGGHKRDVMTITSGGTSVI